jgi:hypothetical protein
MTVLFAVSPFSDPFNSSADSGLNISTLYIVSHMVG